MNNTAIPSIRFGTDGWRGIIADDFTFDNIERVARAVAAYAVAQKDRTWSVTIGYDTRFESKKIAETVARVLCDAGCDVMLSDRFISTPALSSSVVDEKSGLGIMISASHNPPEFNGFKIKTSQGASAPESITSCIERLLATPAGMENKCGSLKYRNFVPAYFERLGNAVDLKMIKRSRLKIVADPMYGAGIDYLDALLKGTHCNVINIHSRPDPLFGGLHPEPIEQNLTDLKDAVCKNGAYAGLATDGDADRLGVVNETGRYLTPHQVFPLLLYYLCHYKKMKGKVVQAISLGYVSERIAKDYGLQFEEVPIGFKYIAERIMNEHILIGGEESGGYGYGTYLPERDGILNSLMIIEMLAATGKTLTSLVKEIEKKYGTTCYLRTDFKNPGIPKREFVDQVRTYIPEKIAGIQVKQIKDYDGIELVLEDDSWLLLRPSGTEPIIRVYAESDTLMKTKKIISWGKKTVGSMRTL